MPQSGAVVFLDFDGTITLRDATDAILERFAHPLWLEIEDAWMSGAIGSRDCLAAQLALVTAGSEEVDSLLDGIGVDPGFATLLDICADRRIPVHIVSDGFDYCIERILGRPTVNLLGRLAGSQLVSSGLRPDRRGWRTSFPYPLEGCPHGCATCKPAAMERLNGSGAATVFVGDGISDRYAAARADLVFAKDKLAGFCKNASIPYEPYDTLAAVAVRLEQLLEADPACRFLSERSVPAHEPQV